MTFIILLFALPGFIILPSAIALRCCEKFNATPIVTGVIGGSFLWFGLCFWIVAVGLERERSATSRRANREAQSEEKISCAESWITHRNGIRYEINKKCSNGIDDTVSVTKF